MSDNQAYAKIIRTYHIVLSPLKSIVLVHQVGEQGRIFVDKIPVVYR